MTEDIVMNKEVVTEIQRLGSLIQNESLTRTELLNKLFDDRRDIDTECGYPKQLTADQLKVLYDREGHASRIVEVWPEETWQKRPIVFEDDTTEETEFEAAWNSFCKKKNVFHYLCRADILSGIGRYGLLFIGFNDGLDFADPVPGMGSPAVKGLDVLYFRTFDESLIQIHEYEKDPTNPRFGHPVVYNVLFQDIEGYDGGAIRTDTGSVNSIRRKIHWTRVIHIADNRQASEVFGTPRLEKVYNRVYDIRKIAGSSAEMFYKGGFPGLALEMQNPDATLDTTSIRSEMQKYLHRLQRYIALKGLNVKSLPIQIADPESHINIQLDLIALALGIPKRVLFGSERGELASSQDKKTHNARVAKRQEEYAEPLILRAFIDRLGAVGVLELPEEYFVKWPDLNAVSEEEKTKTGESAARALSTYVNGGVEAIIPPAEFLKLFMGLKPEQVEAVQEAMVDFLESVPEEDDEDLTEEEESDDEES